MRLVIEADGKPVSDLALQMDALIDSRPGPGLTAAPTMPPGSALAMPVQSLSRFDKSAPPLGAEIQPEHPWLARLAVFGGGLR